MADDTLGTDAFWAPDEYFEPPMIEHHAARIERAMGASDAVFVVTAHTPESSATVLHGAIRKRLFSTRDIQFRLKGRLNL